MDRKPDIENEHYIGFDTAQMSHDEWLDFRADTNTIGGSEVSIILGLNKWQTSYSLWMTKKGLTEREQVDNPAIHWGNRLEQIVGDEFQIATNIGIERFEYMLISKKYPWLSANLDFMISDGSALLEVKTANDRMASQWGVTGSDEVPYYYYVQVQQYLIVTGLDLAYVAVLIGGSDFRWYKIAKHDKVCEQIITITKAFHDSLEANERPPIDGHKTTKLALQSEFMPDDLIKEPIEIRTNEIECLISDVSNLKSDIKTYTEQLELNKNRLIELMGNHEKLTVHGETVCTNKYQKGRANFDKKAATQENAEFIKRHTTKGEPARAFRFSTKYFEGEK